MTCAHPDCTRTNIKARGLCRSHYDERYRVTVPTEVLRDAIVRVVRKEGVRPTARQMAWRFGTKPESEARLLQRVIYHQPLVYSATADRLMTFFGVYDIQRAA